MTVATNTTEGQVILSGDLTGTGSAPELRASGVVPGDYKMPSIVVDAKGRVIFARNLSDPEIRTLIPLATTSTLGLWSSRSNEGLEVFSQTVSVSYAGIDTIGGIRVNNLSTFTNGAGDLSVQVPVATASSFGIARIGANLSVNDGLVTADGWLPATASVNGMVSVNTSTDSGLTISNPSTGSIEAIVATNNRPGIVLINTEAANGGWNHLAFDGTQQLNVHLAGNDIPGAIYGGNTEFESGSGLSIDDNGFLNFSVGPLSFPTASASTSGVVRVGTGLEVESSGWLHVIGQARARTDYLGTVQPGTNFNISETGVLSARLAQNGVSGIIRNASVTLFFDGNGDLNLRKADSASGVVQLASGGNTGLVLTNGNIEVDSTVLRTFERHDTEHVQIFQGNVIEYNISSNFEIPVPTVTTPGTVYQVILRKTTQSARYTMGSGFRLNRPLNNSFSTFQALKLTLICVSNLQGGIYVLQSEPFTL